MTIRYVIFEVGLQDSVSQMEASIIAEAQTYGALIGWFTMDANYSDKLSL
ncbi:hypothetical protein [Leptolyngbya sp. BC1307]|nr:hypothetical protein [Leptolyngbya sp. BC1307]